MSATLMERLKESTAPLHNSAEGSKFQSLLTAATLPKDVYADYLGQLYLVHSTLENEIRKHESTSSVLADAEYQVEFLAEDLRTLGRDASANQPARSTRQLMDDIEKYSTICPEALLGMHYVLLGSKHGGKFIARNAAQNYLLTNGSGARYFDPYGSSFMSIWKGFKERMNQLNLDEQKQQAICEAAGLMFRRITEIGDELLPR